MRTLHVAAMPFPSEQGTQALVHAIVSALSDAGHDTHLLCYPHGAFQRSTGYTLHRSRNLAQDRSLRSGPSLRKVIQDVQLASDLRRLHTALRPTHLIAHHVEAAYAAQLAGIGKVSFVAHTSLSGELGSYYPPRFSGLLAHVGRSVDRGASRRALRRFAISPALRNRLSEETGLSFAQLTPPWDCHRPIEDDERYAARAKLGFDPAAKVLLYAGNLDAYQGLGILCAGLDLALAKHSDLHWLVATAADSRALLTRLTPPLRARTRFIRLEGDKTRRLIHAAGDLALVPRQSPGGLPIKLLDALAHGLPVLACQRACAGFEFGAACQVLEDDSPDAWASSISRFFDLSPQHRKTFANEARAQLRDRHDPARCVGELLSD